MSEVTRALARALVVGPDEGGPPLDPGADEVLATLEQILETLPLDERLGARFLLRAVRYLPFVIGPRRGRFDRLARPDARAMLERLMRSRLRAWRYLFFCLKSLVTMAYFSRPSVWPAMGYDGVYLGRVGVQRLVPPPLASGPLPPVPPPPEPLPVVPS